MRRLAPALAPVLLALATAAASSGDDPAPNPSRVQVRLWWLDVPPARAECWRDPCSPRWRAFTAEEGEAFLARFDDGSAVVSSAETTLLADQPGTFEVHRNVSYVADYDAETSGMGHWDVEAIRKEIRVGTSLVVTPHLSEDRHSAIHVEERATELVTLRDEAFEASFSKEPVVLQFPETAGRSWTARIPATDGGYLLLFGPQGFPGEKGTARLALVSARAVAPPK